MLAHTLGQCLRVLGRQDAELLVQPGREAGVGVERTPPITTQAQGSHGCLAGRVGGRDQRERPLGEVVGLVGGSLGERHGGRPHQRLLTPGPPRPPLVCEPFLELPGVSQGESLHELTGDEGGGASRVVGFHVAGEAGRVGLDGAVGQPDVPGTDVLDPIIRAAPQDAQRFRQ